MENRERERVSQRNAPTETGQSNRRVEEEKEREHNSTRTEFGQSSGRSDNLEGGNMNDNKRNDKMKDVNDKTMGDEPSRQGNDYNSSTGRPGSMDNMDRPDLDRNSDLESDVSSGRPGKKGELGSTGVKDSSGKMGNSSEGRH